MAYFCVLSRLSEIVTVRMTRRELFALMKSVEHFHKYLYGQWFLLRTNRGALKWLMQFTKLQGQIARWIEYLQEYDFQIEHRAETSHKSAARKTVLATRK